MSRDTTPVYLDCAATTPMEPSVARTVMHYLEVDFGNAGSRTHEFGARAKQAVEQARASVAQVVAAEDDEIFFTSGATESNNLAILGLADHGLRTGKRHIVTTAIEHKAVIDPLRHLEQQGFEVTWIRPSSDGVVDAADVIKAVRKDTLLVTMMAVNNETGVIQPVTEVVRQLGDHPCYLHTDAAQSFGKELDTLRNERIDLISISAHKVYGPKGVGALVARRRNRRRPPLTPLLYGGGQERGLRSGTVPVPLVAGFGVAAQLCLDDHDDRRTANTAMKSQAIEALSSCGAVFHGNLSRTIPTTLNFSVGDVDSEALIVALKDIVAVSNGSACTSSSYQPSHVLTAMGLPRNQVDGAIRMSWYHRTPAVNWPLITDAIRKLL